MATTRSGLLRPRGFAATRALAAVLSPLILWQAVKVRRAIPRLPEADGDRAGVVGSGSGAALRLLVLGESTAVGVGVTDQRDGLGYRVAGELAQRTQARVEWHLVGRSGATVADVTSSLLHDLPGDLDLVVVVFGVNDTLRLRARRAWRRHLGQLIDAVMPSVAPAGRIAILGVPDFATLPALPQPLRTILHWHALALDRELKAVIARRPGCVHVPAIPLPVGDYLSHDRFHPNAAAYTVWAAHIADTIAEDVIVVGRVRQGGRMAELSLTATAGGTTLLAPLLAQWDTSLEMLLGRLAGLTDAEYRWHPTPGAADLVDDGVGGVVATTDGGHATRTIAWTLGHLVDVCWKRADYTDGAHDAPLPYQPFTTSADDAIVELRAATSRWRAAVAGANAEQALQIGYSSWPTGMDRDLPFVDIVWWMNRELIAHGSDIATVRDLYGAGV